MFNYILYWREIGGDWSEFNRYSHLDDAIRSGNRLKEQRFCVKVCNLDGSSVAVDVLSAHTAAEAAGASK